MAKYICDVCGYVYDEAKEGPWDKQPDSYVCPVCHVGKNQFSKQ